jgi:hypothetical protein
LIAIRSNDTKVFGSNHLKKLVIRSNAFLKKKNEFFSLNWPGHAAARPNPPPPAAGPPIRRTARRATVQRAIRHVPSPGHAAAPLRWQLANHRPLPHWQDARRIRTAAAATIVEAPGDRTSCDDDQGWHLHAFDGLLFQIRLVKKVQQDAHGRDQFEDLVRKVKLAFAPRLRTCTSGAALLDDACQVVRYFILLHIITH